MHALVPAFLIGVVAGLRPMTAWAAVSWAARLGWVRLENTPYAFMNSGTFPELVSVAAISELIADTLWRKAPAARAQRVLLATLSSFAGAICGAALGGARGGVTPGLLAGALGAAAGAWGAYELRARMARATGEKDFSIALLENAMAVGGAFLIAARLR